MPFIQRAVSPVFLRRGNSDKVQVTLGEEHEAFYNSSLANTIRQLASLQQHATEIHLGLTDEFTKVCDRTKRLSRRILHVKSRVDNLNWLDVAVPEFSITGSDGVTEISYPAPESLGSSDSGLPQSPVSSASPCSASDSQTVTSPSDPSEPARTRASEELLPHTSASELATRANFFNSENSDGNRRQSDHESCSERSDAPYNSLGNGGEDPIRKHKHCVAEHILKSAEDLKSEPSTKGIANSDGPLTMDVGEAQHELTGVTNKWRDDREPGFSLFCPCTRPDSVAVLYSQAQENPGRLLAFHDSIREDGLSTLEAFSLTPIVACPARSSSLLASKLLSELADDLECCDDSNVKMGRSPTVASLSSTRGSNVSLAGRRRHASVKLSSDRSSRLDKLRPLRPQSTAMTPAEEALTLELEVTGVRSRSGLSHKGNSQRRRSDGSSIGHLPTPEERLALQASPCVRSASYVSIDTSMSAQVHRRSGAFDGRYSAVGGSAIGLRGAGVINRAAGDGSSFLLTGSMQRPTSQKKPVRRLTISGLTPDEVTKLKHMGRHGRGHQPNNLIDVETGAALTPTASLAVGDRTLGREIGAIPVNSPSFGIPVGPRTGTLRPASSAGVVRRPRSKDPDRYILDEERLDGDERGSRDRRSSRQSSLLRKLVKRSRSVPRNFERASSGNRSSSAGMGSQGHRIVPLSYKFETKPLDRVTTSRDNILYDSRGGEKVVYTNFYGEPNTSLPEPLTPRITAHSTALSNSSELPSTNKFTRKRQQIPRSRSAGISASGSGGIISGGEFGSGACVGGALGSKDKARSQGHLEAALVSAGMVPTGGVKKRRPRSVSTDKENLVNVLEAGKAVSTSGEGSKLLRTFSGLFRRKRTERSHESVTPSLSSAHSGEKRQKSHSVFGSVTLRKRDSKATNSSSGRWSGSERFSMDSEGVRSSSQNRLSHMSADRDSAVDVEERPLSVRMLTPATSDPNSSSTISIPASNDCLGMESCLGKSQGRQPMGTDETASLDLIESKLEEDAMSVYSVDQDGFYTTMKRDSCQPPHDSSVSATCTNSSGSRKGNSHEAGEDNSNLCPSSWHPSVSCDDVFASPSSADSSCGSCDHHRFTNVTTPSKNQHISPYTSLGSMTSSSITLTNGNEACLKGDTLRTATERSSNAGCNSTASNGCSGANGATDSDCGWGSTNDRTLTRGNFSELRRLAPGDDGEVSDLSDEEITPRQREERKLKPIECDSKAAIHRPIGATKTSSGEKPNDVGRSSECSFTENARPSHASFRHDDGHTLRHREEMSETQCGYNSLSRMTKDIDTRAGVVRTPSTVGSVVIHSSFTPYGAQGTNSPSLTPSALHTGISQSKSMTFDSSRVGAPATRADDTSPRKGRQPSPTNKDPEADSQGETGGNCNSLPRNFETGRLPLTVWNGDTSTNLCETPGSSTIAKRTFTRGDNSGNPSSGKASEGTSRRANSASAVTGSWPCNATLGSVEISSIESSRNSNKTGKLPISKKRRSLSPGLAERVHNQSGSGPPSSNTLTDDAATVGNRSGVARAPTPGSQPHISELIQQARSLSASHGDQRSPSAGAQVTPWSPAPRKSESDTNGRTSSKSRGSLTREEAADRKMVQIEQKTHMISTPAAVYRSTGNHQRTVESHKGHVLDNRQDGQALHKSARRPHSLDVSIKPSDRPASCNGAPFPVIKSLLSDFSARRRPVSATSGGSLSGGDTNDSHHSRNVPVRGAHKDTLSKTGSDRARSYYERISPSASTIGPVPSIRRSVERLTSPSESSYESSNSLRSTRQQQQQHYNSAGGDGRGPMDNVDDIIEQNRLAERSNELVASPYATVDLSTFSAPAGRSSKKDTGSGLKRAPSYRHAVKDEIPARGGKRTDEEDIRPRKASRPAQRAPSYRLATSGSSSQADSTGKKPAVTRQRNSDIYDGDITPTSTMKRKTLASSPDSASDRKEDSSRPPSAAASKLLSPPSSQLSAESVRQCMRSLYESEESHLELPPPVPLTKRPEMVRIVSASTHSLLGVVPEERSGGRMERDDRGHGPSSMMMLTPAISSTFLPSEEDMLMAGVVRRQRGNAPKASRRDRPKSTIVSKDQHERERQMTLLQLEAHYKNNMDISMERLKLDEMAILSVLDSVRKSTRPISFSQTDL